MENALFNKVLDENEKCVFYENMEGTLWPTQYIFALFKSINIFEY